MAEETIDGEEFEAMFADLPDLRKAPGHSTTPRLMPLPAATEQEPPPAAPTREPSPQPA